MSKKLKSFMHPEASSLFRRYQHTPFVKGVIHAFRFASKILPLWFMRASAVFIIVIFIILNLNNFRAVMKNLSHIKSTGLIRRIFDAYRVFLNYSFYLIDLFYMSHDHKRIKGYRIDAEGEENFRKLVSGKQGFILITLHMGNWEVGGSVLSSELSENGSDPYVVYSPDTEGTIESQRIALREFFKVKEVPLRKGEFFSLRLLNLIRDGKIVAFQGDRLFGESGVEMDFFGKKARFPKGPVALAMVANVPIIPAFTVMKGYKHYKLYIEKPCQVNLYSTREETIRKALSELAKIFEKYIYKYNEQWYAFMPFWADDQNVTGE